LPKYRNDVLDSLAHAGDPLADDTVEALFAAGEMHHFNTLMRWFNKSGDPLPEGLPPTVHDYLEATKYPPEWTDWELIDRAREFFLDNNANISTALSFAAMPACYAVPQVAKVLTATHELDYPALRMAATGQFVVYLLRPDSFEEGSLFIPAAQKVRLLHASIRHHLRDAMDITPVSQEDMIGAVQSYSVMVLDSLHRLGVHITNDHAEAYFHAWRVAGAMMGCDTVVMPESIEEGREYSDLYYVRHLGPSDEGVALTRDLIRLYEDVVPGRLMDPIVPAMIRYLVGDTVADWLEVPRSHWDTVTRLVPVFLGAWDRLQDSGAAGRWITDRFGGVMTNLELSALTSGRVMHYAIPEQLKEEYGVRPANAKWTPPPVSI
jgi:hypothetical protein